MGVRARDLMTGDEFDVRAKSIVFAGGPFTDSLREMEDPEAPRAVSGAAGTHIVLPGYYCPREMGLLDINTSDGRFLFFLPWQGCTLVGTTDRKGEPVSTPLPPEEEIKWILNEASRYLSDDLRVRRSDVLSAWQGWRPLAVDPHAPPDAPVSRDHIISTNPVTGITFITGGKWTTYREMAEDVIDRVVQDKNLQVAGPCITSTLPLLGAEGYERNLDIKLTQKYAIAGDTAKHLASTYGTRAYEVCERSAPTGLAWPRFGQSLVQGFPFIEAEVEQAVNEYARTVKDVIALRTRLAYLNVHAAREAVPRVAVLMGDLLEWDDDERARQEREAMEFIRSFGGPVPADRKDELIRRAGTATPLKQIFAALDSSGDGYLDMHEFVQAAEMLGAPFPTNAEVRSEGSAVCVCVCVCVWVCVWVCGTWERV